MKDGILFINFPENSGSRFLVLEPKGRFEQLHGSINLAVNPNT